jgi:acyl dehydratase
VTAHRRGRYGQRIEEYDMSKTTTTLAKIPSLKGSVLGVSDWFEVTQDRVNTFADATEDHQWIHVNPERAAAESPFGGPIGHGFPTLSLFVPMRAQILTVSDAAMGVNYGLNKVRFTAPVPVGSRIRLTATLLDVEEVKGGLQFLSGTVDLSDDQLDRLLSCMGYRLEVTRRPVIPELTRSERRSWRLPIRLTPASLQEWHPVIERNIKRLRGFSIDDVDLSTSASPTDWRGRPVKVQNAI